MFVKKYIATKPIKERHTIILKINMTLSNVIFIKTPPDIEKIPSKLQYCVRYYIFFLLTYKLYFLYFSVDFLVKNKKSVTLQ